METTYGSNAYLSEFFIPPGSSQNNYVSENEQMNTGCRYTDQAFLPFTVIEQNGYLKSQHQQQYQYTGNMGLEHPQFESFPQYGEFENQYLCQFNDESIDATRLQLIRERNRIASNKCR